MGRIPWPPSRLRADPVEWAAWQPEIAELDGTLGDGLSDL